MQTALLVKCAGCQRLIPLVYHADPPAYWSLAIHKGFLDRVECRDSQKVVTGPTACEIRDLQGRSPHAHLTAIVDFPNPMEEAL